MSHGGPGGSFMAIPSVLKVKTLNEKPQHPSLGSHPLCLAGPFGPWIYVPTYLDFIPSPLRHGETLILSLALSVA